MCSRSLSWVGGWAGRRVTLSVHPCEGEQGAGRHCYTIFCSFHSRKEILSRTSVIPTRTYRPLQSSKGRPHSTTPTAPQGGDSWPGCHRRHETPGYSPRPAPPTNPMQHREGRGSRNLFSLCFRVLLLHGSKLFGGLVWDF